MTKVILITGASSGLGKATAAYLKQHKYNVLGTCRDPKKYNGDEGVELLQFDLNQLDTSAQLVEQVLNKTGRIDVLINNAGAGITGPIEEIDPSAMESHFKTNLFGHLI